MKLTKSKLKQIIKEEVQDALANLDEAAHEAAPVKPLDCAYNILEKAEAEIKKNCKGASATIRQRRNGTLVLLVDIMGAWAPVP